MREEIHITDRTNKDFLALVQMLETELDEINFETHQLSAPFNKVDTLLAVVVIYVEGQPVACGGLKQFDETSLEIKRIFVRKGFRKLGLAQKVMAELERIARERGCAATVLETGTRLTSAVSLYKKLNYQVIPSYGPYKNIQNTVCFRKEL